jgi:hypothetical protein
MPGALETIAECQLPNRRLIDLMMAPARPMPAQDER